MIGIFLTHLWAAQFFYQKKNNPQESPADLQVWRSDDLEEFLELKSRSLKNQGKFGDDFTSQ